MIKRLLWLLTLFLLAAVTFAEAQSARKVPTVGLLTLVSVSNSTVSPRVEAFRQRLHDLGYVEGKNIVIEYRYGDGKLDRLSAAASELVQLQVDVIVTGSTPGVEAAKNAFHSHSCDGDLSPEDSWKIA